jgi:SAM-dependent methyltransferase
MAEINLLDKYPKSKRPIEERGRRQLARNGWLQPRENADNEDILIDYKLLNIARKFGKEYFDGDRLYGYGGYYYHPKFWTETVKRMRSYYNLADDAIVLDIGCAKGFMLYDFKLLMPKLNIAGLDISQYAYDHAMDEIRPFIKVGNGKNLPYTNNSFDLVISINTIDHLPLEDCKQALSEIARVAKKDAFISVNAWRNEREREFLFKWNITALTVMHVDHWNKPFNEIGYKGDYWWCTYE